MNKQPLVIYHGNCADGFTAAWVIWTKHPDWEFYAGKYGSEPPNVEGRDVFMVDFSYKRLVLMELAKVAKTITVIDHHKTAQGELSGIEHDYPNVQVFFDMEKSGARLAWEYFNGNGANLAPNPPKIVTFVEDRDLWRFNYSNTRAISAYIFATAYTFENWNDLAKHIEDYTENVILQGQAIELKHFKDIDELSSNSFRANIGGYNVPVINVPYTLASDMCHKLAQNEPFAASFYYDGSRNKLVYSLRSTDTGVDVSAIAKEYGGGGHAHAAGFETALYPSMIGLKG